MIANPIDQRAEFENSPAFRDYRELLAEIRKLMPEAGESPVSPRKVFTEDFFHGAELLIRYGAFKKIGKGSSRTAYTFDADPRYVLKFAHNVNGLRQNQTEIKNVKSGDYKCMVRNLAYDSCGILIVEDYSRESSYSDWYRILGMSPNMLSKIIRVMFDRRKSNPAFALEDLLGEIADWRDAAEVLKKTSPLDDEITAKDHPVVVSCVENMVAAGKGERTDVKWLMLSDLVRFYCDNGLQSMIAEELLYVDQWGVVPGASAEEDALIIIDPGVDDDFRPFVGRDGRVR